MKSSTTQRYDKSVRNRTGTSTETRTNISAFKDQTRLKTIYSNNEMFNNEAA
jgi:hypothetical protein